MEKISEKGKWHTMTNSAKKLLRSSFADQLKVKEASSRCFQPALQSCVTPSVTINPQPSDPSHVGIECSDTVTLLSKEPISAVNMSSNGLILPAPEQVLDGADSVANSSLALRPGDRKRTLMRYIAAVEELKSALRLSRPGWETFEFPEFDIIPESNESLTLLQEAIEEKLNTSHDLQDKTIWQKGKILVERLFVGLSPFAKNFLTIARGASQSFVVVNPYGVLLCGLLLLLTAANKEIVRKGEIEKKLDYIVRRLDQLKVISELPDSTVLSDDLVNRAMDVRSASLKYIAAHIRHESQYFGIVGRIATTIFMGDEDCSSACTQLYEAVNEFNSSLSVFGQGIGLQTLREVKELRRDFATIQLLERSLQTYPKDRFVVPYQRNEHFMGRQPLLGNIHKQLSQSLPNNHNHRIALYGLGGVGKTQLALEYAYTHQAHYDGIYWISAVNPITIFSGFRDIAKRANCLPYESDLESCEKHIISWLNQQDSWLMIFDNLNDATVIDGLLPNVSPRRHILFTTRNPNSDEIPAEALEIGVLDLENAVDFLLIRSRIKRTDEFARQKSEAERIVRELGFLPLAIEQAAAYIREVSRDISKFLPSYRNNRQKYHQRLPRGNWKYQKSVATTWRLSFEQVEQSNIAAARLLRLLSFLNPDLILTDFLEAGCDGLDKALRYIIADSDTLYEALSDLERWSIIRRQQDEAGGQRISIHRLVQSVIKDEMTETDFSYFTNAVISLCDRAFPLHIRDTESRMVCRRYQAQVIIPLSAIPETKSNAQLEVLERIAWFLHDDGKYAQSRELRLKTLDMCALSKGREHPDTLLARGNLALTYRREGRLEEAMAVQIEVMEAMERCLGTEHPDTLKVMSELALTYLYHGCCDDALRLHERALEARTRVLGEDHPDTLTAMSRLAATYRDQERWDKAINLHEKVLQARSRLLGEEHPDTLMAMSSLAYSSMGSLRWDDAIRLLTKVLEERTRLLGEEHMDTLVAMSRLGHAYSGQHQWDVALTLQLRALNSLKRICGEEHRDSLTAMTWLASTYWDMNQGQRGEAVNIFERVLAIRRRTLGDMHPTTLRIARILEKLQKPGDHCAH